MSATKFTPENRGALLERTAAGVSLTDACCALDLRKATVKGWLTRGRREQSGEYADFARRMDAARESAKRRGEPMDPALAPPHLRQLSAPRRATIPSTSPSSSATPILASR